MLIELSLLLPLDVFKEGGALAVSLFHVAFLAVVLDNSTKKRQHYFDILKAFFVRHSSEYKTSDSDRRQFIVLGEREENLKQLSSKRPVEDY